MDISKMVKKFGIGVKKYSPELLTGVGIAGMIMTTVLAVKATPKAMILLDEKKENEETEELDAVETIKTVWKCYIPSAVTGVISVTCLICASSVNARRRAALATAYSLSETALKEYRKKVVETIGEKKEQAVRDAVAKDKVEKNPPVNKEVIVTGKGETLCYDAISGRYFKSDIETLRRAENELNKTLINEMYVSLNEFYYLAGLKETQLGDDLGWNIDDDLVSLSFSSQLADDGTPCLVVSYQVVPRYDYRNLH